MRVAGPFEAPQMVLLTVAHVGGEAGQGVVNIEPEPPGAPLDGIPTGSFSPPLAIGPCLSLWLHYEKSSPDAPEAVGVDFEAGIAPA